MGRQPCCLPRWPLGSAVKGYNMRVNQGGTTTTGKVVHAVFGEWSYDGANIPWCTGSITLSGVRTYANSDVEVTCKRCIKTVVTYDTELRNLAFEVVQLYRYGFSTGPQWLVKSQALFRALSDTAGLTAIQVARIVLSGNKEK